MTSFFNGNLKFSIFGESHSPEIGMSVEGLPEGFEPDLDTLQRFLDRRAPGQSEFTTPRKEADKPEFTEGLTDGRISGRLTAVIKNTNTRSGDYSELKFKPRPGHADFTATIKHGEKHDYRGGGHFSGRLTAPLCILGGLCLQLLEKEGISVESRITEIAGICGDEDKMKQAVLDAKAEGDSVGGVIECIVLGLPVGLGDAMFDGMESRISRLVFGIPAVKGIEFGLGFGAAKIRGSENNDPFEIRGGNVVTKTNNCGGILGGITDGMPLVFRAAIKPTPSISIEQDTVNLETMENAKLKIIGRHDPCIVFRALPCVEAAAAIAIYDALIEWRKENDAYGTQT